MTGSYEKQDRFEMKNRDLDSAESFKDAMEVLFDDEASDDDEVIRPKREAQTTEKPKEEEKKPNKPIGLKPTKLRRTNSANSFLGLGLVLDPQINKYGDVSLNNFYGFKVKNTPLFHSLIFFSY